MPQGLIMGPYHFTLGKALGGSSLLMKDSLIEYNHVYSCFHVLLCGRSACFSNTVNQVYPIIGVINFSGIDPMYSLSS